MPQHGEVSDYKDYNEYFNSLTSFSKHYLNKYESELNSYHEFNKFIEKFNEKCISGRFINDFKKLYNDKINETIIINFIIQTIMEIEKRSVEDYIYEERKYKINSYTMERKINENRTLNK